MPDSVLICQSAHSSVVKTGLDKKRTWQKKRALYDEQKAFRGKLREMREEENKIVNNNFRKFTHCFLERKEKNGLQGQAKEKGRKYAQGLFLPTCNDSLPQ